MNREQRRRFQKKVHKNPALSICPECGYQTLFYTTRLDNHTVVKCEICDKTIREGAEVEKLVPPGIILPLTLEAFDKALLWEASHPSEEKKDETTVEEKAED